MTLRFRSLLALALSVAAAGCGSTQQVRYANAEEAYQRGEVALERRDYDTAVQYFQGVFTFGRSDFSDDAQLGLAHAYEGSRQYLLAANAYRAFYDVYQDDPRVPDAYLGQAAALERQTTNFELDQTDTRSALVIYQAYVETFPTHARVPEAQARIVALVDRLAHKAYASGALYERRGLDEAAGLTYERAFNAYPQSGWGDDALVGVLRSFTKYAEASIPARQTERFQRGLAAYERLVQIFPQSPLRAEADTWAERARTGLAAVAAR
ncbi:MAG: outer membrane protein assembly factor BamD [Rhodothermales bacterium]|nr:outer membrane protein assembly factor BamD [Rhodothermales bacterium]MCA0268171.1 outer membrane protein assembly factor BamD [Bacteroidota bacterium]